MLVPVRGGPNAELAVSYAAALADRAGATLVVLHLLPSGASVAVRTQAEKALAAFIRRHAPNGAEPIVRETSNVRSAIVREAAGADLLVMGASAVDAGNELFLVGSLPEEVAERAACTVVVVRTREPIDRTTFEHLADRADTLAAVERAAEASRSVPARVDRWFGESNYHHGEFADLERLVELKQRHGTTVSLVLRRAQRGRDDRADRGARTPRPGGARARSSTRSSSSTASRPTTRGRSPRTPGRASCSTRTSSRGTAASAARARRSGRACTRRPATSWSGATPT